MSKVWLQMEGHPEMQAGGHHVIKTEVGAGQSVVADGL